MWLWEGGRSGCFLGADLRRNRHLRVERASIHHRNTDPCVDGRLQLGEGGDGEGSGEDRAWHGAEEIADGLQLRADACESGV